MKTTTSTETKIIQNGGRCLRKRPMNGALGQCGNQTDDRLLLIHAMRGHMVTENGRGRKAMFSYSGIKEVIIGAAVCDECMEKHIQKELREATENAKAMKQLGIFGIGLGAIASAFGFLIGEDYWIVGIVFALVGLLALLSWLMRNRKLKALRAEINASARQALYKKYKVDAIMKERTMSSHFDVFINADESRHLSVEEIRKAFGVDENTAQQVKGILSQYNKL